MAEPIEVARFRKLLTTQLGWVFEEDRVAQIAEVLERRALATNKPIASYLFSLEKGGSTDEVRALAKELTVNETFFFRNHAQFDAFAEVVLPARLLARPGGLKLLSAGCSTGDEAYSLAILLRERLGDAARLNLIRAVDVNPAVLERARKAEYSAWSLRETPRELQHWFVPSGKSFTLPKEIRDAVVFEERNLATADADLWAPETWDVVFCRNMLMYLEAARAREVVSRIARSLAPGGYFFLGHAETMRGLSDEFDLCNSHNTFYYQRRASGSRPRPSAPAYVSAPSSRSEPPDEPPPSLTSWVDQVQQSSDRIKSLAEQSTGAPAGSVPAPARSAFDFTDTLARAIALTEEGRLDDAEALCRALIQTGSAPVQVGAHYLLGLASEAGGDVPRAMEHHRTAISLDAQFSMARLHLGLLAKKQNDVHTAHRELTRAVLLLGDEEPSRLQLFAGGFSREQLTTLCQRELNRLPAGKR